MTNELTRGATALRGFIEAHGLSLKAAATGLRIEGPTLHAWMSGMKRPRAEQRMRIARWTHGAVPCDAWLTDCEIADVAAIVPYRESA